MTVVPGSAPATKPVGPESSRAQCTLFATLKPDQVLESGGGLWRPLALTRQIDAGVPVYLITGFLPEGFDLTGVNGVVTKPLDLTRIRALVAQAARR